MADKDQNDGKDQDQAQEQPKAKAEAKKVEVGLVRAKDDHYDPIGARHFRRGEEVEATIDGWMQAQLDAGNFERLA